MTGQQGAVAEYKDGVQFLGQGRLRLEYDDQIHYLNVEKNMIINLLSRMKKFTVERQQHFWQIQERKKDFVTLDATPAGGAWAGGAAATGTLLLASLTDAFLISKNDLFIIPSVNEVLNFYVDSIDQGTGIITARTVTGATIDLSAVANGKDIFLTSNSFEDGGGRGTIKAENPTDIHNFVQIIQTPQGDYNMNSYERVFSALNLEEPDHVPIFECSISPKIIDLLIPEGTIEDLVEKYDLDSVYYREAYKYEPVDEDQGYFRDEWV